MFSSVVVGVVVVNPSSGPNESCSSVEAANAMIYSRHHCDPFFLSYDVWKTLGEIFAAVRVVR